MIDSSVCLSWKPIDFLDNIPKYSNMFSELSCVLQNEYVSIVILFQIWLMIQRVVCGRWVGG